jgi:hypothetical protein
MIGSEDTENDATYSNPKLFKNIEKNATGRGFYKIQSPAQRTPLEVK